MSRYYSNKTENESDGYWVYYNGELYHAGIKGMHWYQHLPGTVWWKNLGRATKITYEQNLKNQNKLPGHQTGSGVILKKPSKLKAIGAAAGEAIRAIGNRAKVYAKDNASYYGNKVKGFSSEKIAQLSEFARKAYASARGAVQNYFKDSLHSDFEQKFSSKTPMSHLDEFQNKQMRDAVAVYERGKVDGSFGNTLNQWFQNAQYGIVKGVNNYLKQFGLDDEVDSFIGRITGRESAYGKNRRLEKLNSQMNNGNLDSKQKDLERRR